MGETEKNHKLLFNTFGNCLLSSAVWMVAGPLLEQAGLEVLLHRISMTILLLLTLLHHRIPAPAVEDTPIELAQ